MTINGLVVIGGWNDPGYYKGANTMYKYRDNSPRWIKAKFKSTCSCGNIINKGDNVLYYPSQRKVACKSCSETHQREMDCNAFDESVYNY